MKNKIKYFVLYPLMLLIVILTLTYDVKELIGLGQRIPFGSSYWKDSLSDAISTNKSIKLGTGDSIYYNGVVVTSGSGGGGDVVASANNILTGNNTFSNGNTFSDSLRANGYSLIDDAKITSYLRVTGEVTTDLNFNKGSLTKIGTISTDSLEIMVNNTSYIKLTPYGKTTLIDSVILASYDIFPANGKGFNWLTAGVTLGSIYSNAGELINKSNTNTTYTLSGNFLNSSDSSTGFLVRRQLEGYADTVTSASKWFFSDIITFSVSPVFSSLVNFANGINVTGNGVFSGNITADTLKGKGNQITGVSRIISFSQANLTTWADSTTYYFGGYPTTSPTTTEATYKYFLPCAGTIKGCIFSVHKGGTAGSAQNVTAYIRINGSDNLVTSTWLWTTASNYDVSSNYSLSIPFVAGDYLTFKIITPNWNPTNPTNCQVAATIYYQ